MTPSDIRAALDTMSDRSDWVEENWNTIRQALRFTLAAMEPNESVINWSLHENMRIVAEGLRDPKEINRRVFKAMTTALFEQVSKGDSK